MKTPWLCHKALILCVAFAGFSTACADTPEYLPGKAILKWDTTCARTALDMILSGVTAQVYDSIPQLSLYAIQFPDTQDVPTLVNALAAHTCIGYVDPDYVVHWASNDSLFPEQWYLDHTTGQPGAYYADVMVNSAWAVHAATPDVVIGVFDTGIPWNENSPNNDHLLHPDLQNPSQGYPFILHPPGGGNINDADGHGTKVVSVIAAHTNNEIGLAGIADGATIHVYKGLFTDLEAMNTSIRAFADIPSAYAKIFNLSGGIANVEPVPPSLVDAVVYAGNHNTLIVAAMGDWPLEAPLLPAGMAANYTNLVAVTTTDWCDGRGDPGFSCWPVPPCFAVGGLYWPTPTVAAPGTEIRAAVPPEGYTGCFSSTSAATAIVSGTCALIVAASLGTSPALTPAQIKWQVLRGSVDLVGNSQYWPYGRVNAFKALLRTPGRKELQSDLVIPPHYYDSVSPYYLEGGLVVPAGKTLTIEPGTRITLGPGAYIEVRGSLIAVGADGDSIRFEPAPGVTSWNGIQLIGPEVNGGQFVLDRCVIHGCETAIYAQGVTNTQISNCRIYDVVTSGLDVYQGWQNSPFCENNDISSGLYGIRGNVSAGEFRDNRIHDCNRAGIYWYGDGSGLDRALFHGNEVSHCGYGDPVGLAGACFMSTTVNLECNTFSKNIPRQVRCTQNGHVTMNGDYGALGHNVLENTSGVVWCTNCNPPNCQCSPGTNQPLLWLWNSRPHMSLGGNTFRYFLAEGTFIYDQSNTCANIPYSVDLTGSYYELNGQLAAPPSAGNPHFCPPWGFMDQNPLQTPVACGTSLETGLSGATLAYQTAADAERAGNMSTASSLFRDVISQYPDSEEALWSTRSYLRTGLAADMSFINAHDSLQALWQDEALGFDLRVAARHEAVWALLSGNNFGDARMELQAVAAEAGEDSLWAVITLELVDFLERGGPGIQSVGDAQPMQTRLHAFHNHLLALQGEATDDEVLAEMAASKFTPEGKHAPNVPLSYALEQNYPNPFNSMTEIGFELPRAEEVELDVFDILGRRVAALVQGKLAAGAHRVDFDASELASGIYVYRLQAGEFSQSRKMVMLK